MRSCLKANNQIKEEVRMEARTMMTSHINIWRKKIRDEVNLRHILEHQQEECKGNAKYEVINVIERKTGKRAEKNKNAIKYMGSKMRASQ